MRDRPNMNWIESVYYIPNSCTHCNKPFFVWDDICVEDHKEISLCLDCSSIDDIEPIKWHWWVTEYSSDPKINIVYNVSDISKFEKLIWEKVQK